MERNGNNNSYNSSIKADVVTFTFQIILILIVVCVSLLNLTMIWGNQNFWTVILTSSFGYIMPNPRLKDSNDNQNQSESKSNSTSSQF